ncbi:tyrosine-type recombinase/integrase [Aeromonas salmonicida]|uniref:tyrosine-type recombinase/integrase n=1 Tax=Aeromonas salmonicida TaxID=645 RepID=UPI0038B9A683
MASIQVLTRKTGKSYRVQFMRNGNRVSKVFTRKKDAEQFLAQITVSDELADALTNVTLTSTTIQQAINEYLEQHKGRDKSVPQRLSWWAEHIGDKTLNKVNRQRIRNAISILEVEGKAPATLNRYKAALSAVFVHMCDRYDLKVNPCLEVKQKREDNARTRYLSVDELPRLMKATKTSKWERLHMLVHMALTTGARRSELIGLKWSDINFSVRTAHLAVTKNGSQRVLSLTDDLRAELSKFREIGTRYVFPHPSQLNQPFAEFDYHWQAAKKAAVLTDFHFHDLRHTCASLLAMNGASLLEIAEVLGHKSITMTQRYAHLCIAHKAKLTDRVFGNLIVSK